MNLILTPTLVQAFTEHLHSMERAPATVSAYRRAVNDLLVFAGDEPLNRELLIRYKHALVSRGYAPVSVNAMLAAVNALLAFLNRRDLTVKPLRIQKLLFCDDRRELTRDDYGRLVDTARKRSMRLSLVIQTICVTGIRVSELRFITAEAVRAERAEIANKGKRRIVFLPEKLRRMLERYLRKQKRNPGTVFTTRTGKPLNRSNIWRDMKALCRTAKVDPARVFPHNLRHLFARTHYAAHRDMIRLADVLGHASINTTRIYTAESGRVHARQIETLGLLIT